ncbi:MAG: type III-B CRISPR-associated protein Cas10/Cmr2, partial [Pyrinomonadaceae bacterium]
MEERLLVSISIGPVQDFIATARRSHDLWFGSHLLSELSKAVALEFGKENLIFPAISDESQLVENSEYNVVNKILVVTDKIDRESLDRKLRQIIEARLVKFYEPIFSEIEKELSKNNSGFKFYKDIAKAQIDDLAELFWAAVPYNTENFNECRNKVELLLNARKSTRNFNPVTWGSNSPKSSLDGNRESVIQDKAYDKKVDLNKIQRVFHLRGNERLSGVDVLKRLGAEDQADRFLSTSHLASLPFIQGAGKENFKSYVEKLTIIAESGFNRKDGQVIYKSRLKDYVSEDKLVEAKGLLDKFLRENPHSKNPTPYFALLQADGDRMGAVIDNQNNLEDYKQISKALSEFAGSVKEIVEKYRGCLIYSGGDDVLAMLPLHTVLECTRKLADKFAVDLKGFKDDKDNSPTLSAGIAIVHHTEPLQESLETMRRAEKEAKSVDGKNALAITLSKRSGSDTTIKGSWENDRNTKMSFDERFKWLIQLQTDEALPHGVAYELRDLWLKLGSVPSLEEVMKADASRILIRKDA